MTSKEPNTFKVKDHGIPKQMTKDHCIPRNIIYQGPSYPKDHLIPRQMTLMTQIHSDSTFNQLPLKSVLCDSDWQLGGDSPFSKSGDSPLQNRVERIQTSRSVSSLLESKVLYRLPSSGLKAFNVTEKRRRFFCREDQLS